MENRKEKVSKEINRKKMKVGKHVPIFEEVTTSIFLLLRWNIE